jgi:RES domain-containing protein
MSVRADTSAPFCPEARGAASAFRPRLGAGNCNFPEINPIYASDPLSGRGAGLYGGRFNPKGMLALYASLSPMPALREANQVGALQPIVLVAYEADIRPVFDTREAEALSAFGLNPQRPRHWRLARRANPAPKI